MSITQAKFDRLMSDSNNQMKKVYDVVPIAEYWPIKQIDAEMRRKGINADFGAVAGILDSLVRVGLVKEQRGSFTREAIRKNPGPVPGTKYQTEQTPEKVIMDIPSSVTEAVKTKTNPIGKLKELAARANSLGNALIELSSDLDDAIKAVEMHVSTETEEMKKMKMLRETLKHFIDD